MDFPRQKALVFYLPAVYAVAMKRLFAGLIGLFVFAAVPASANVDDFEFESFAATYHLGIEDSGASTLLVEENLVALFPEYDQNRGLARYIPRSYQEEDLETEILSVSDGTSDRDFSVFFEEDFVVVESVVPEGSFVQGRQVYEISYSQRHIIGDFPQENRQEFYWDINGTGWPQFFGRVSADVIVDQGIVPSLLADQVACYRGSEGSTSQCDVAVVTEPDGSVRFSVNELNLGPFQTVTIAFGFQPDTFVAPERGLFALWWQVLFVVAGVLSIAMALTMLWARMTFHKDQPGRPTIITEYLPPKEVSIAQAAHLLGKTSVLPTALLLDLAVRGHIRLREGESRNTWEVLRTDTRMDHTDEAALRALLGELPAHGTALRIPTKGSSMAVTRMQNYLKDAERSLTSGGFYAASSGPLRFGLMVLFAVLGSGLSIAAVNGESGLLWFSPLIAPDLVELGLFVVGAVIVAVPVWVLGKKPLSAHGADARDYLKGLRIYLELAEKDRLAFLQSPKGALRETSGDSEEVLKLYETVLPWAILLGVDKEWFALMERYYQDRTPLWITGPHISSLGDALSSMSSSTRASYQSSSSGGSSGGGSAGGGGGGGGGGGR